MTMKGYVVFPKSLYSDDKLLLLNGWNKSMKVRCRDCLLKKAKKLVNRLLWGTIPKFSRRSRIFLVLQCFCTAFLGSVTFKVQVEVVFPSGFFGWSRLDSG